MAKFSDLQVKSRQHVLVYGEPGSGKTQLVSKLAEKGFKLIWFSLDNGHWTIMNKLSDAAKENLDVCVIPDSLDWPVASVVLPRLMEGKEVLLCREHGNVSCSKCKLSGGTLDSYHLHAGLPADTIVVFDHITQYGESIYNKITGGRADSFDAEGVKEALQEYGLLGRHLNKFLSAVQVAPFNIVCIAQVLESESEDGSKKLSPWVGTKNYSVGVAKNFDHVVYCDVANFKHNFGSATTYKNKLQTKSRSDVAIEKATTPDLSYFFSNELKATKAEEKKHEASSALSTLQKMALKK